MRSHSLPRRAVLLLAVASVAQSLAPAWAFTADKLDFAVRIKDEVSSHRVMGVFVLPAERLEIEILQPSWAAGDYQLHTADGHLEKARIRWLELVGSRRKGPVSAEDRSRSLG